MIGYDRLFPPELVSAITDMIESRTVSAGDIINRRQTILSHHKVATSSELALALLGSLSSMSDSNKKELIGMLRKTIADEIDIG
jgi:hypothetical protein